MNRLCNCGEVIYPFTGKDFAICPKCHEVMYVYEDNNIENKFSKSMEEIKCKKHKLVFVRNIYDAKTPKSEWKCSECGKTKFKNYYNKIEG